MEPTLRLLRVRGIAVGAHWTWAVAFAVVAGALARSVLPSAYPGLGTGAHLLMAVAATALLFVSVVLHELAHAVAARREGMPVAGVTLWLLGGVSDVGGPATSPGQELRVAASGPAVSLVLAGALATAAAGGRALGWPEAVPAVFGYAARLNLLVAAFNLIPALPLDGGRILRAWLWRRQGDQLAATRSAARAGQAFGLTLVVVGILDLWAGARMGVGLAVVGALAVRAATSELADARTRHHLSRLTAADVMVSDPGVVLHDTPVERLVERPPTPERMGYPVVGQGRLLGVVALASARRVSPPDRAGRRVEDIMTPLDDIPMVDARDPVLGVLDRLDGGNPIGHAVVVDDGFVVGIVDEDDVARALDRPSPERVAATGADAADAGADAADAGGDAADAGGDAGGPGPVWGLAAGGGGVPRHRGRPVPAAVCGRHPRPRRRPDGRGGCLRHPRHPAARALPGPEHRAPSHECPRGPRRRGSGRPPARSRGRRRVLPASRRGPRRPGSWPRWPPPAPRGCRRRLRVPGPGSWPCARGHPPTASCAPGT